MEICLESVHMVVACATGKTCRFQYYQERGQKLVHRTETLFEITTQLSWTPNDARTIRTPTNNKAIVQKIFRISDLDLNTMLHLLQKQRTPDHFEENMINLAEL